MGTLFHLRTSEESRGSTKCPFLGIFFLQRASPGTTVGRKYSLFHAASVDHRRAGDRLVIGVFQGEGEEPALYLSIR
jgi:hypothetical protein